MERAKAPEPVYSILLPKFILVKILYLHWILLRSKESILRFVKIMYIWKPAPSFMSLKNWWHMENRKLLQIWWWNCSRRQLCADRIPFGCKRRIQTGLPSEGCRKEPLPCTCSVWFHYHGSCRSKFNSWDQCETCGCGYYPRSCNRKDQWWAVDQAADSWNDGRGSRRGDYWELLELEPYVAWKYDEKTKSIFGICFVALSIPPSLWKHQLCQQWLPQLIKSRFHRAKTHLPGLFFIYVVDWVLLWPGVELEP